MNPPDEMTQEEILARIRAVMDQNREMAVEVAHSVSTFYLTLVEDGLPQHTAESLTRDYLSELAQAPPEE